VEIKSGVLRKDTYLHFQADYDTADIPSELLTNKITNNSRFNRLLRSIRIPAGSPVITNRHELKIIHKNFNFIIRIFRLNGNFFFTVYDRDGRQSIPRRIVFPNGAPPYPYPISLLT